MCHIHSAALLFLFLFKLQSEKEEEKKKIVSKPTTTADKIVIK